MQHFDITSYDFLKKLKKLPWVEEIWIYGSRARGDNQERSDIDLAIVCPSASRDQWHITTDIIEEADTLLEIDCVRLDTISDDDFKKDIERYHKVVFNKGKNE